MRVVDSICIAEEFGHLDILLISNYSRFRWRMWLHRDGMAYLAGELVPTILFCGSMYPAILSLVC